jgi:uncharacterized protein (TIGR02594 family)
MMISRRHFVAAGALSPLLPDTASAAEKPEWRKVLEDAIATKDPVTLGHLTLPPDDPAWQDANTILDRAPNGVSPIGVAEYFVQAVPRKYQMAWPEPDPRHPTYANPVIVRFFLDMHQHPEGDTVPWCAVFVNWCLSRAGIAGTESAASQRFLQWGKPVWTHEISTMPVAAQSGDIAVFRRRSDPEHGHVAFFKTISTTQARRVEVLGGNQIVGRGPEKLHLIDVRTMRVDGDLELAEIRTADGLRR